MGDLGHGDYAGPLAQLNRVYQIARVTESIHSCQPLAIGHIVHLELHSQIVRPAKVLRTLGYVHGMTFAINHQRDIRVECGSSYWWSCTTECDARCSD